VSGRLAAAAAALPLTELLAGAALPASSTPAPDPLEKGRPSATQLADAVADIERRVDDIDLAGSLTELETETSDGDTTVVTLSSDILFAFGSADLSDAAQAAVTELGDRVAGQPGEVTVTGHTDSVGSDADNMKLSLARARAVATVLEAAIGDGSPSVTADGRGEREPVASDDDPAGAAQNRRVEVRFGD
jgi:outer membrane protein OmpA-like peptidoglycan-associated protein